jgi:hypothetical protein
MGLHGRARRCTRCCAARAGACAGPFHALQALVAHVRHCWALNCRAPQHRAPSQAGSTQPRPAPAAVIRVPGAEHQECYPVRAKPSDLLCVHVRAAWRPPKKASASLKHTAGALKASCACGPRAVCGARTRRSCTGKGGSSRMGRGSCTHAACPRSARGGGLRTTPGRAGGGRTDSARAPVPAPVKGRPRRLLPL